MSLKFHRNSLSKMTPIMAANGPQSQFRLRASSFIPGLRRLGWLCLVLGLVFLCVHQISVYASQDVAGNTAVTADQGSHGITGYVVGAGDIAAYACPDVNTTKCPIKLKLKPGTQVVILDNVIGGNVPGLNDNAWRKIAYQGQILFVPMRYISITRPDNALAQDTQDVSFVQTSNEDDSTTAPANGTSFSTAPSSTHTGITRCITPCTCPPGTYQATFTRLPFFSFTCCPLGYSYNPAANPGAACIGPSTAVTSYQATDGRIDGNAGDRIAIYCRRTGRIEVWSIIESQGHFLVEFNHNAVDKIGRTGLSVNLGSQGVVTIGGDGQGLYWVSLFGGPGNGSGAGDFAKIFHCYVR